MNWPLDNLGPYGRGAEWKEQGGIDKVFEAKYDDGRRDQAALDFIITGGTVLVLGTAALWKKIYRDSTKLIFDLTLEDGSIVPSGTRVRNIDFVGDNVTFTYGLRNTCTTSLSAFAQATQILEE